MRNKRAQAKVDALSLLIDQPLSLCVVDAGPRLVNKHIKYAFSTYDDKNKRCSNVQSWIENLLCHRFRVQHSHVAMMQILFEYISSCFGIVVAMQPMRGNRFGAVNVLIVKLIENILHDTFYDDDEMMPFFSVRHRNVSRHISKIDMN